MARLRVAVPDEEVSVSERAARLLGQDIPSGSTKKQKGVNLPQPSFTKLVVGVIALLVVLLFIALIQSRNSLQKKVDELSRQSNGQSDNAANELVQIQTELSKFMELPANETPTLATVSNIEKVKGQTFFKNAQNGDKVLLYSASGRAILYRPSTKKVIEVAAINTPPEKQP